MTSRLDRLATGAAVTLYRGIAPLQQWRLSAPVAAMDGFLTQLPPQDGPLISVVLATRNRASLLRRALGTVAFQTHPAYELVIVDDGSVDATREVADGFSADHPGRVRVVAGPGRGLGAARNTGLDVASGEIVTYLDDDNLLWPRWLQALAWTFTQAEPPAVVYGVRIAAGAHPGIGLSRSPFPQLTQHRWSPWWIQRTNFVDVGVLAHRRDLRQGRFDEALTACSDWDLVVRLSTESRPRPIPAIACTYTTDAPGRLSDGRLAQDEVPIVQARARRLVKRG